MGYYTSGALSATIRDSILEQRIQEAATTEGLTASVELVCPFQYRWDVVNDIVGNGLVYAREPLSLAFAKTATIAPLGGQISADGHFAGYEKALVTINYEQDGKEENGVDIFAESLEPSAEFLQLPSSDFRWASASGDAVSSEEAPGFMVVGFDYVQTEYQRSSIPSTATSALGKCNTASVAASVLGLTFAAETLMFATSTPSRTIKSDGTYTWTWTKRFSFRPNGWNKFWRAKTQSWESIYISGGSEYKSYPPATLPIV